MIKVNDNYSKLQDSYLFSKIAQKVEQFTKENPDKKIIKLGIGDVTLPIVPKVGEAIKKATDEMLNKDTFKGYGPEQGYMFLREKIVEYDYKSRGIDISADEVFVSDGAKCDTGNIGELFSLDNKVAITDPVYPVYLDTNVMAGRTGYFDDETGKYEKVVYMPTTSKNNFVPELPDEVVDIIYLCFPNNPTGTVLTKEQLQVWVDYATKKGSIILFDAAYEAFITEPNIPHSIYEIPGAKNVAIEFKSFSKTAGFTGLRCAYTVVPKELEAYSGPLKTVTGESPTGDPKVSMYKVVQLNKLWNRRQCTKFNGVSYITQRAAEAVYTEEGRKQINENIKYYLENAKIILEGLKDAGYEVYGGKNAPYIWLKVPNNMTSWEFFDYLLEKAGVVGTPGEGFGPSGEGYFRLTAFGTRESTLEAIERIKNI